MYVQSFCALWVIIPGHLSLCPPVTPHVPLFRTGFHIIYHMSLTAQRQIHEDKIDHAGMTEAQLFILNK